MDNVLSSDERKLQKENKKISSVLMKLSADFLLEARKQGVNIDYLTLNWNYNDGKHLVNGGI